jgi:diguanylate cyclase (GGDEF)-like protein
VGAGPGASADDALTRAYAAEVRRTTRSAALVAGAIAIVVFPAWSVFDALLLPDQVGSFLRVRVLVTALLVPIWLLLLWRRSGERWPEQLTLAFVAMPEVAIAWMVARSGEQLEPYLLGLSIAIWISAFLLTWRWQLTALLVAVTGAATALFVLTGSEPVEATRVGTMVFYILTTGAFAVGLQLYRSRTNWRQFVTQAALEDERRRNEALVAELDHLSRTDPLTAVGNRRAWEERLLGEFLRARRAATPMSVLVCDFDHFKDVNDLHGHPAGDAVLRHGARLLADRCRATDFVARLGGDEFGIVCPGVGIDDAENLATSLVELARATTFPDGVSMTFSVGVAELRVDDRDAADLLQRADAALYRAKVNRDVACV